MMTDQVFIRGALEHLVDRRSLRAWRRSKDETDGRRVHAAAIACDADLATVMGLRGRVLKRGTSNAWLPYTTNPRALRFPRDNLSAMAALAVRRTLDAMASDEDLIRLLETEIT